MNFIDLVIFNIYKFLHNTSKKRLLPIFIIQIMPILFLQKNDRGQIALNLMKISIDHRLSNLSKNCLRSVCFNSCFKKINALILNWVEQVLNKFEVFVVFTQNLHFIQNRDRISFNLLGINLKHHIKSHLFVIHNMFLVSVQVYFELDLYSISRL